MKRILLLILLSFTLGMGLVVTAQDSNVVVPDVTGLNAPQAAAVLNQAGLALGNIANAEWDASAAVPSNTVGVQTPAAGDSVASGTAIDITMLRETNVRLIYDNNDITMINDSGVRLNLENLRFLTLESSVEARFRARRWAGQLRSGQCTQLWSVSRNGPKGMDECNFIQNWMTTNNPADHFWTAANGVQTFYIEDDGEELAVCQAAPPNSQDNPSSCSFYVAATGQNPVAQFVHLTYTTDQLVLYNSTDDAFMRGNKTHIINANPNRATLGDRFLLADTDVFGDPDTVANIRRLAPNQCLVYTSSAATDPPPEDCDVIATLELAPEQLFWSFDFQVQGIDGKQRKCNAATPDKRTICLMPR